MYVALSVVVAEVHGEDVARNGGFELASVFSPDRADEWTMQGNPADSAISVRQNAIVASGAWSAGLLAESQELDDYAIATALQSAFYGFQMPANLLTLHIRALVETEGDAETGVSLVIRNQLRGNENNLVVSTGDLVLPETNGQFVDLAFGPLAVPSNGSWPNESFSFDLKFWASSGESGTIGRSHLFLDSVVLDRQLVPEPASYLRVLVLGALLRRRREPH